MGKEIIAAKPFSLDIYAGDHRLRAVNLDGFPDHIGVVVGNRVENHLFKTERHDPSNRRAARNPATICHGHESFSGDVFDDREIRFLAIDCRADVEKNKFIYFFLIEDAHRVYRVPDVQWIRKLDRLDQSLVSEQENWHNSRFHDTHAVSFWSAHSNAAEGTHQCQAVAVRLFGVKLGSVDVPVTDDASITHRMLSFRNHI